MAMAPHPFSVAAPRHLHMMLCLMIFGVKREMLNILTWVARILVLAVPIGLFAAPFAAMSSHAKGLPEGWFLLGSLGVAACVLLAPRLLHNVSLSSTPKSSTTPEEADREVYSQKLRRWWFVGIIVSALILQFDVGHACRTVFSERLDPSTWMTLSGSRTVWDFCIPRERSADNVNLAKRLGEIPETKVDLVKEEYSTAINEIRQRVDQEQALFYLKFGVVAAVLAGIFKLLHDKKNELHDLIGDWRLGNTFLWAAVLGSAIVDARLRYNSKMIETLGCWIYLVEARTGGGALYWETYLRSGNVFFSTPTYALLRSFPNLLTILLFIGIVYYSLVKTEEPLRIARFCACGTVILLASTCVSFHGESMSWLLHCLLWLLVGSVSVIRSSVPYKRADAQLETVSGPTPSGST